MGLLDFIRLVRGSRRIGGAVDYAIQETLNEMIQELTVELVKHRVRITKDTDETIREGLNELGDIEAVVEMHEKSARSLDTMKFYQLPEATIATVCRTFYVLKHSGRFGREKEIFLELDRTRGSNHVATFGGGPLTMEDFILHVLRMEDTNDIIYSAPYDESTLRTLIRKSVEYCEA
tara:strand:+ start:105 stop:635 length:531 start_codon:yes stop_codon:yes gene_type:complete